MQSYKLWAIRDCNFLHVMCCIIHCKCVYLSSPAGGYLQYSGQKPRCTDQHPEPHSAIGSIPGPPCYSQCHHCLQGPLCADCPSRERQGFRWTQWVWSNGHGIPDSTGISDSIMFIRCDGEMSWQPLATPIITTFDQSFYSHMQT